MLTLRPGAAAAGLAAVGAAALLALAAAAAPGRAIPLPVRLVPTLRLQGTAATGGAFGLVGDVAAAADGRIFVLDVLMNRVSVFARDGRALGSHGRPGSGPGELAVPAALTVGGDGRVYVLDRGNARIAVYGGPASATGTSLPLDFNAEDLCFADGRLYVLGERNGALIHEMSPETGSIVHSFAPDPAARDPLMRGSRSNGYLGCADGRREIVFLPFLLPELRRYDARTGAVLGIDTIPDYRAVRIRRLAGAVAFEAPRDGPHHVAAGVVPIPGGQWLVQTAFVREGARSRHELEAVRSFLLPPSGSIRAIVGEQPRLVSAYGRAAFHAATEPHPRVEVLDLEPVDGAEP